MAGQAEEKRCFALAERLQKLIAAAGLCSRRTAEEWIAAGRVRVNGETATVGQSADPETDTICVDGVPVTPPERRVYLMLNKPRGYVTTLSDERGRPTAAELVADCGTRVYPVGRLDLDSEGLLLFTNDGAWMQRILHPSHEIEKTYEVTVAGAVENAAAELAAVRSVDGEPIAPARVRLLRKGKETAELSVTIHEGKNRQIRRMCAAVGLHVKRLRRVREHTLSLGALPEGVSFVIDQSLAALNNSVCGANEEDYHYTGYNVKRDTPDAPIADFAKTYEGAICPCCGKKSIRISRGIEVGNIFQLGTKYTKSMDMTYIGQDGKPHYPIMGCYGIGVGRLCASVCEAKHDDYGPIWPMSIAPWQVHICAIKANDPQVRETADALYNNLQAAGVEVLYDDRKVSAGNMFSDADLLGVPVRVIVSPKTMKRGCVEVSKRDKSLREDVAPEAAQAYIENLVQSMLDELK